jgi:hypothetical protein
MSTGNQPQSQFREGTPFGVPIRDLGLSISGTSLEPVLEEFKRELEARGIRPIPHFYLSTEWGVPFGTISLAIPFYLARPDLTAIHAERAGHLEGAGRAALLRYLRHEMGHVVNYAYKLYESSDWIKLFGSITQPYLDEYHAQPFSRRFVNHLPGWYAQKHPDEDWSETFAVWLTPSFDWRTAYSTWPDALAKLEYCDVTMAALRGKEPLVTEIDPDEAVEAVDWSLQEYYEDDESEQEAMPPALDAALRTIFEDLDTPEDHTSNAARLPAADLIRQHQLDIIANVYRWTGHFPERTRSLLLHLAARAEALQQQYPADRDAEAAVAVTALVTSLAMNYVLRGSYIP